MTQALFRIAAAAWLAGTVLVAPAGAQLGAQHGAPEARELVAALKETVVRVPVRVPLLRGGDRTGEMLLTHFRPEGQGPFPIVVMLHGRSVSDRANPPRHRYLAVARYWTRRGFAVLVPTRLGYGETGVEPDAEYSGPCNAKNYRALLEAGVIQVSAALQYARRQPWADGGRVIVMGASVGGFITVAVAGRRLPGVIATINFSGGAGGDPQARPGNPCGPRQIEAAFAEAGRAAQVPGLFLYAENDRYWGADLPRRWHAAYVAAGGRARLVSAPPIGEDGHQLLNRGFRLWRKEIDRFLVELGFATPRSEVAVKPSGYAELENAEAIPFIKPGVKTEQYPRFLDADIPRAFAIAPNGSWAFVSGADAVARALSNCQGHAKRACALYAVDDAVVWRNEAR